MHNPMYTNARRSSEEVLGSLSAHCSLQLKSSWPLENKNYLPGIVLSSLDNLLVFVPLLLLPLSVFVKSVPTLFWFPAENMANITRNRLNVF